MEDIEVGERVVCFRKHTWADVGEFGEVVFSRYGDLYIHWNNDIGGSGEYGVPMGHGEYTSSGYVMTLDKYNELKEKGNFMEFEEFKKLKVGDYVRIADNLSDCYCYSNSYMRLFQGKVVKVIRVIDGIIKVAGGKGYSWNNLCVKEKVDIPEPLAIGDVGGEFTLNINQYGLHLAYVVDNGALRAYNSQKFVDIIKNNYVIVNDNNRVINNFNPHIKDKLEAVCIHDWRIDDYCLISLNDDFLDDNDDGFASYKINFTNGEFTRVIPEGVLICPSCARITMPENIFGKYCKRCLTTGNGLAVRFGYHCYRDGYDITENVDTSKVPVFGCEIERDYTGEYDDFNDNLTSSMLDIVKVFHKEELENGTLKRSEVFMCDGSLNYDGLEWITFPHTFDWYIKNKDKLDEAIALIKDRGFKDTKKAGNHIHINRDFFGKDAEFASAKIALLFNTYWEDFVAIAGRNLNKCHYTTKPIQEKDDSIFEVVRKTIDQRGSHGVAVNLQHAKTIEIRLWSAIRGADDLIFFLDNMQALARYAKKSSLEKVQKAKFTDFMKFYKLKSSLSIAKSRLSHKKITKYTEDIKELMEKVGK